jgi:hypothetical protein
VTMSNDQATGLAFIGLGVVVILAGIAASISPLGIGAAVIGLGLGLAGAIRLR